MEKRLYEIFSNVTPKVVVERMRVIDDKKFRLKLTNPVFVDFMNQLLAGMNRYYSVARTMNDSDRNLRI